MEQIAQPTSHFMSLHDLHKVDIHIPAHTELCTVINNAPAEATGGK